MKIGIISYTSGYLGDNIRVTKFTECIQSMGFEVEIFNPFSKISKKNLIFQGIKHRSFIDLNLLRYGIREIAFDYYYKTASGILQNMLKNKEIDILQAETHSSVNICTDMKNKFNIPVFFDIHDEVVEVAKVIRKIPNKVVDLYRNQEFRSIKNSDVVFVVSKYMKEHYKKIYPDYSEKMIIVSNGADPYLNLKKKYIKPLNVVYVGVFAYWEHVNDYLDAIKYIEDKDHFNFYLIGDGYQKKEIMDKIEKEKIPVKYLGLFPREELREILKDMHIGVAPSSNDIVRKVASPIKVFEYMSMGMPVVTADVGEWSEIVKKNNTGIVIPPEDPKAIADAIMTYEDEELWRKHSNNGIKLINEQYSWEKIIKNLKPVYERYSKR